MRLSITMCTYGHAPLLNKTLRSIFGQTRMPDQIVIVEDGNNDEGATRGVCMNLRGDLPIEYYCRKNRPNIPYCSTAIPVNCAIKKATGDTILMMADDTMFTQPTDTENLVAPVEADSNTSTYSNTWKLNPAGEDPQVFGDRGPNGEPAFMNCTRGQAIRRDLLIAMGGLDESFKVWGGEDDHLFDRLQRWNNGALKNILLRNVNLHHQWHPDGSDKTGPYPRTHRGDTLQRLRKMYDQENGLIANYGQDWGNLES